ncbi:DNA primase [Melissospora conviva]|uniref:DNA primase n=1 Tax=Melissospora conviva TaxID=3388432 RepID=UPI003B7CD3A5
MARQSSSRPDEPGNEPEETSGSDDPGQDVDRSLWEELRIDPVEIALPAGAGYTLRAYRSTAEVTGTDTTERDEDDPFVARSRPATDEDDTDSDVVILDEEVAAQFADDDEATTGKDGEQDEAEEDEAADEEVPVFLTHRGKLLLFKSPEGLVSFVRSGAANDMAQLDTWDELVERLEPEAIAPLPEDSYELDLVVENLRGGHDAWDPPLLITSGEVARDLAYALRLPSVLDMLSPGSSLDDLDEALRASAKGGLGGMLGRRRTKKIGAQTASLGWRTIVGKISAVVDWRD